MVQLTMSDPYRRGSCLNPSEGIFTIHFFYQMTGLKEHGCTRTCLATVMAQGYFLEVVHWYGLYAFGQDMTKF